MSMADQRSKQNNANDMFAGRPTTLPILSQNFQSGFQLTPGDYTKLHLTTPELDSQARGFTTPELLNVLAGATSFEEHQSPGVRIIEEYMNPQQINNRTNFINQFMPNNHLNNINSNRNYQTEIPMENIVRDRSISSSIHDQDSSNSTIGSSPGRPIDELQHVPLGNYQINDEDDTVKREKKRERNRQAAQKCRTRKLNRIAELQKRVDELQGKNRSLTFTAETLKSEVLRLEKQLDDHRTQGCALVSDGYLS